MRRADVRSGFMALLAIDVAGAAIVRGGPTLRSDIAPVELTVPDGWEKSPGKQSADPTLALTAVDAADGLGVAVVFEPKRNFDVGLDGYAERVLRQMGRRLTDWTHTNWVPLKVGTIDGLQCDIHGTTGHVKFAYVVTVFGTADSYDRVAGYTTESRFADHRPALAKLAFGFRQTGPAPATRPAVGGPVRLTAKNGIEEMILPAGWIQAKERTAPTTELLAYNVEQNLSVKLISEDQRDLTYDLPGYAEFVYDGFARQSADASHTPWLSLKVNGNDALQCDVRLTLHSEKYAYVVTVLQTPGRLEQVLAWTNASSFDQAKPALDGLASGLRRTSPK